MTRIDRHRGQSQYLRLSTRRLHAAHRAVRLAGGSWEQYIGQRYELVALRALCAGDAPRARWAGGLGKELILRSLFAPDLPKELFRKVMSYWAPVWD